MIKIKETMKKMPESQNSAPTNQVDNRPFRERKSLGIWFVYTVSLIIDSKCCFYKAARIEEVQGIRAKFPNKIPVIVERFHKERALLALDKTKFLVPQELTMSQFITIIR